MEESTKSGIEWVIAIFIILLVLGKLDRKKSSHPLNRIRPTNSKLPVTTCSHTATAGDSFTSGNSIATGVTEPCQPGGSPVLLPTQNRIGTIVNPPRRTSVLALRGTVPSCVHFPIDAPPPIAIQTPIPKTPVIIAPVKAQPLPVGTKIPIGTAPRKTPLVPL
jgi:hypothetical protein